MDHQRKARPKGRSAPEIAHRPVRQPRNPEPMKVPQKRRRFLICSGLLLSARIVARFGVGFAPPTPLHTTGSYADLRLIMFDRWASSFDVGNLLIFKDEEGKEWIGEVKEARGHEYDLIRPGLAFMAYTTIQRDWVQRGVVMELGPSTNSHRLSPRSGGLLCRSNQPLQGSPPRRYDSVTVPAHPWATPRRGAKSSSSDARLRWAATTAAQCRRRG